MISLKVAAEGRCAESLARSAPSWYPHPLSFVFPPRKQGDVLGVGLHLVTGLGHRAAADKTGFCCVCTAGRALELRCGPGKNISHGLRPCVDDEGHMDSHRH